MMNVLSRRALLGSSGALLLSGALAGAELVAAQPSEVAWLNRNENPFGPSPRARSALIGLAERACRYPYAGVVELRAAIARHEGVRADQVFVSAGSGEILKLAALIHAEPGREVIAARPTFLMLPQYASRRGADVRWVDVDSDFGHDFTAMSEAVTDRTGLVYVCNPNNPTGTLADPARLRAFIQRVSPRTLVVVDEAYIDFAPDPKAASVIDLGGAGANVLVTRTFSKLYGLAGLRIGYAVGPAELVRRMESLRMTIPNQAGVLAALASLEDEPFRAVSRRRIGESVAFATRLFDQLGLRHAPTHANFVMFDSGAPSSDFVEFARERYVMTLPVHEPFATWVRVSMGLPEEMQAFARVLREFVRRA